MKNKEIFINQIKSALKVNGFTDNLKIIPLEKGLETKNYLIVEKRKPDKKYVLKIYKKELEEEVKYELEILDKLNSSFSKKFFPIVIGDIFYINDHPSLLLKYIDGKTVLENFLQIKFFIRKYLEI